jgi:hypothetical protein
MTRKIGTADVNALETFKTIVKTPKHGYCVCSDPYHKHNSPIQEMFAFSFRGHYVSVTIDGESYSVRIDRDPLTDKHGMTRQAAANYVEGMTE